MRISDVFKSKYIKAADLPDGRITVTIAKVTVEDFGDDDEKLRFVAWFKELEQGLILNRTNSNMLEELSGSDDSDSWTGLRIDLYSTRVDFQGKRVPAVRIEAATSRKRSGGSGGGGRGQKPLPLQDKVEADEPENSEGKTDPDTEADAEGFPWEKEMAGGKS